MRNDPRHAVIDIAEDLTEAIVMTRAGLGGAGQRERESCSNSEQ